ncbi:MAG: DUF4231 domain-containing protein [Bacteroidales bacterium]|nr:DUF4231 domain-containing protein [Bacteroidales bacterium]
MESVKITGIESLRSSLDLDITRFSDESSKHKRLHRKYQRAVIILTAVTTVVAGSGLILPTESGKIVQFAVLCLTASTAAISAWSEMRRARELWQHERDIFYRLVDIRRELVFVSANRELKPQDLEDFFKKIADVLGSSTQKWSGIIEKNGSS